MLLTYAPKQELKTYSCEDDYTLTALEVTGNAIIANT